MIRVGVLSQDAMLMPVLASVLNPEFTILSEPPTPPYQAHPETRFDVLILDFDVATASPAHWNLLFPVGISGFATPVIIMANDESRAEAVNLVARGAYGYVRKPPVVRELKTLLRSACQGKRANAERELSSSPQELLEGLDGLKGSSAPMQVVYKLITKVANLAASVLVTGESGTGKELIARAIHNTGSRAKRPFVAVSCDAIPETLIESELFGHERGAFTGTVGAREGYFETAGDGTLFLDEIGELRPNIQIKLLRVLQERQFNRLGSSRSIPVRARIVLATHRDLEQLVAIGAFRQDLFYRINVMNIAAPALRHRIKDISLLAHHFLDQYSAVYNKQVETIEPEALDLMRAYQWPGNVRELENVMQRAIIMAEGYSVQTSDLPESIQDLEIGQAGIEEDTSGSSFESLLRHYKIKIAYEAIQQCNGNKTLAAQSLSISRAYLHRLIRSTSPGGAVESVISDIGVERIRTAAGRLG